MVNQQPGESERQQWYPRLPEGYEQNERHGQHMYPSWHGGMPSHWMPPGHTPGHGMPGQWTPGQSPGHGMPGQSPGHGMPGQWRPGQSPGHGMPGQWGPGQSPGHGTPGQWGPGQSPGHGTPGQWRPGQSPGHGMPVQWGPGQSPGHGTPGQWRPGHHVPNSPSGNPSGQQAPTSPPPRQTPEYPSHQLYAVDPGAIASCMYRFTYIWTSRRHGFWFYPTFVGRSSVAGYRWNAQRHHWEYYGIDLNRIETFTCR